MNRIPRKILSEEKEMNEYSKSEDFINPELRPTGRKNPSSFFSSHPSTATTVTANATYLKEGEPTRSISNADNESDSETVPNHTSRYDSVSHNEGPIFIDLNASNDLISSPTDPISSPASSMASGDVEADNSSASNAPYSKAGPGWYYFLLINS